MEYLVTMTTHVPDGTPEADVQDIRTREGARARELAAQGHLLRLWRPPLQPGEWRTLGLFAADDDDDLEITLGSMPLRIWRTDEVIPLSPHPNDPRLPASIPKALTAKNTSEYLVWFTEAIPEGTPTHTVDCAHERETDRARELAAQGNLVRLWTVAAERRALGLWSADDTTQMEAILASLPLFDWLIMETIPLSPHPSDPALTGTIN